MSAFKPIPKLLPSEMILQEDGEDRADRTPYGRSFVDFVGEEPDDNPADIFEAQGLIVRGEPSLFIGDPKVGKTLTLEDLMLHIAAGRPDWCGVKLYRRCRVLLFLREDAERTTRRRLHQLARGAGIALHELEGWLSIDTASALYFDDPSNVRKLRRQLGEIDICAIDSLSTIHNADENSMERMAPVMNGWRDLSLTTGTAIPIVHHFRKGTGDAAATGKNVLQRARGSSLIGATTRHAVGMERGPGKDQIAISVESNHEIDVEPFVIRRIFGTNSDGRKYITHKRTGSLQNARSNDEEQMLDALTLAALREAGEPGLGGLQLRQAVIAQVKEKRGGTGVRPAKVDAAASRLDGKSISRTGPRANWTVIP